MHTLLFYIFLYFTRTNLLPENTSNLVGLRLSFLMDKVLIHNGSTLGPIRINALDDKVYIIVNDNIFKLHGKVVYFKIIGDIFGNQFITTNNLCLTASSKRLGLSKCCTKNMFCTVYQKFNINPLHTEKINEQKNIIKVKNQYIKETEKDNGVEKKKAVKRKAEKFHLGLGDELSFFRSDSEESAIQEHTDESLNSSQAMKKSSKLKREFEQSTKHSTDNKIQKENPQNNQTQPRGNPLKSNNPEQDSEAINDHKNLTDDILEEDSELSNNLYSQLDNAKDLSSSKQLDSDLFVNFDDLKK